MSNNMTIKLPGNLWIKLDRDEIYPDDPGLGTPALVIKRVGSQEFTGTFNCAVETGDLGGEYTLTEDEIEMLQSMEQTIEQFLFPKEARE